MVARNKYLATTSSVFSTIFSPLLVPTYGVAAALWLSTLSYLPLDPRWTVLGIVFAITCIIPLVAILTMWRIGWVTDPGLNNQRERFVPYLVTGVCYAGCAAYLFMVKGPIWLWAFPAGGAIATVICAFVNVWWKISAHMAAMGGLVAVMVRLQADAVAVVDMLPWLTTVIVLAGCVATSRVYLRRHTILQTIAGTAAGFLSVYLLSAL